MRDELTAKNWQYQALKPRKIRQGDVIVFKKHYDSYGYDDYREKTNHAGICVGREHDIKWVVEWSRNRIVKRPLVTDNKTIKHVLRHWR